MATWVGTQKDLGAMLNSLIELEYDAVAAYEVAVHKLQLPAFKQQMREFMGDQQRHILALKPQAAQLGVDVANSPDLKQLVTTGKVLAAQLAGDKAILYALQSNEADVKQAYERAIQHEDASPQLLASLERGFSDARRHRAWIARCLDPEQHQPEYSQDLSSSKAGTGDFQSVQLSPEP